MLVGAVTVQFGVLVKMRCDMRVNGLRVQSLRRPPVRQWPESPDDRRTTH